MKKHNHLAIKQFSHKRFARGFTLIEVLLAAFIFTVTIGAITVVFTSSSNMQTQNQVIRDTNQSVQYAIETISRDVKAAKSTYCSVSDVNDEVTSCSVINNIKQEGFEILSDGTPVYSSSQPGNQLKVLTNEGEKVYSLVDKTLKVKINSTVYSLTNTNEVKITGLTFTGVTPTDNLAQQPYVTINVDVESLENSTAGARKSEKATQALQTTITSNYYPYAFNQ